MIVAARALATYLIPGRVGREVKLESDKSSDGGVWKSGNLEIWEFENLEIWGPGNPGIRRSGDLEIQKFGVQQIPKHRFFKIQIRSAENVGKVWISRKKSSWPYLGPSEAIFSMERNNAKKLPIFLGGPMGTE